MRLSPPVASFLRPRRELTVPWFPIASSVVIGSLYCSNNLVRYILQGILFSTAECVKTPIDMVRLWMHECDRVYRDKLVDEKDMENYDKIQGDISKKTFEVCPESKAQLLFKLFLNTIQQFAVKSSYFFFLFIGSLHFDVFTFTLFLACNSWFSPTWWDGRLGVQKKLQNVAKVLHDDRISFPKDLLSFCTPKWPS